MADDNPQSHLTFPEVIKRRVKFYEDSTAAAAKRRNRISFLLFRRNSGDYYSNFDTLNDSWVDVPDDGTTMKYSVIGQAVRANDANWLATRIKSEITGASSDPTVTAAVNVCEAVSRYYSQRDWNEDLEAKQSHYCQLGYTYLLLTGNARTRTAESLKIAKFKKVTTTGDKPTYACAECGAGGDASKILDTQTGDNERGAINFDSPVQCPECGSTRAYLEQGQNPESKEEEVPDGYTEVAGGDNYTRIFPGMCYLIDEEHAKNGNTEDAHWVAIYELVRRYEIQAQSPHMLSDDADQSVKLTPADGKSWIDGLKMWHLLETGMTSEDPAHQSPRELKDDDLLQRSRWFMQPVMWKGWQSPSDYVHPASKFEIKQGETLEQAFQRQGKRFVGLYLWMVGDKIERIETSDHRDRLCAGLWLNDGSKFHGKPQIELNDFQTAANEWFTMFFQHGLHNSMPRRILDINMFDKVDFSNMAGANIYTRRGVARGRPLSDYAMSLEPGNMSSDMFPIWERVIDKGATDASGVSNPSIGIGDPAQKTMGGQQLLTERSLGLMIPSQKSKKRAYRQWQYNQLIHAQKYASDDRLRQMLSKSDKSWDDSDIQAFREIDIRRDVLIDAPEGSDIPVTFTEKEQKLFLVIQSGILWNPAIPPEIKDQVAKYAGIDYDPQHFRRNREYLQRVLSKIEKACDWADSHGKAYVMDGGTGAVVINPMAVQQILTLPGVEVMPRSMDIPLGVEMFNARIVALASAEEPDQFKLKVLQDRVDQLITQGTMNTMDAATIAGHAQTLATGGDTEGQGAGGGAQDAAVKAQTEQMKVQAHSQDKDKDRAHKEQLAREKAETQKELLRMKQEHEKEQTQGAKIPDETPNWDYSAYS